MDIRPDPAFFPYHSQWFDSSRGRVHYIDHGTGPAIVLCHGCPTWSFLFRATISELSGQFRCIAADNLGFGLSDRPPGFGYSIDEHIVILSELVDHLRLDEFIVVGHDWGGPIGVGVAAREPHRLRGIALTNTTLWPVNRLANRAFSVAMNSRPLRARILSDNLLIERFLVPELHGHSSEREIDHYRLVQRSPEARVGLAAIPRQIRSARPLLADLERTVAAKLRHVPTLAVWGTRDRVFPARASINRLSTLFDDLSVTTHPVGHFLPEHVPGALADAVLKRFSAET